MFEKIVNVSPSFNKMNDDPKKDYGVGCCRIWFILKGEKGAIQFQIGTDWGIESVRRHLKQFASAREAKMRPDGWDLGYHSYVPMYEGQESMGECDVLDGKECYYDGSGLQAESMIEDFLAGGTEWLWPELEKVYHQRFDE